jgi:hypothetical protein
MITSDFLDKIAPALVQAQATAAPALKQSNNPHFKSKYADLSACWEAVREPLAAAGLAVLQEATLTEVGVSVTTRIIHSSGQWIQTEPLTVPLGKRDAHGVGSATSYGKRYSLSAALGIVADDDDGNGAIAPRAAEPVVKVDAEKYEAWRLDMEAVAGEGLDALKAAWMASPLDYRAHAMKKDASWWDGLKAKATQHGEGA